MIEPIPPTRRVPPPLIKYPKPLTSDRDSISMKIKYVLFFLFFVLVAPTSPIWGQDAACPTLVQDALDITGNACEGIGRNQICYGHSTVELEPHDSSVTLPFNAPGDLASIADVQTIRLVSMDELFSEWGVALMKLQANIPDTLPGENVTFVLFGDVEIEDAAPTQVEPVTVTVTATQNTDIVTEPGVEPSVIDSLSAGDELLADGRSEGGNWLRVQLDNEQIGWVLADSVSIDGDIRSLEILRDNALPPLRAFYLRTGIGDARCGEAPSSGLLIQTPKGAGAIHFTINNVIISLMSTAYIQAQPNGDMTVSVLEGQVGVNVVGVGAVWVPAGGQTVIPLDENGLANGAPGAVVPYEDRTALTGTLELLPAPFEPPAAISEADLEVFIDAPMFSTSYGSACVPGGVTVYSSRYNEPDGSGTITATLYHGLWTVKAGTTVTFTVGGDTSVESDRAQTWGSIVLISNTGEAFAGSGTAETTWTHTFTEDTEFNPGTSVYFLPGERGTVWMTITCDTPSSVPAAPSAPGVAAPGG
jgi:hypothetical protein